MPLDIIFEVTFGFSEFLNPFNVIFLYAQIFSSLAPVDLISLTRSSKRLREILMTRKAITIWRAAARDQAPDAPGCPPDMSEPAWGNLLFGGTKCQVCRTLIFRISFLELGTELRNIRHPIYFFHAAQEGLHNVS
jgi:hypothetical protein